MLLNQTERKKMAKLVNAMLDIPLVPEDLEQTIFEHAVGVIDQALEDTLPAVLAELIHNSQNGIDKDHAVVFADRLVESINRKIDLPYLDEDQEAKLLRVVIDPLVKAMTNGRRLEDLLPEVADIVEARTAQTTPN
ncbi:MAG TPA: hypothetical protein VGD99_24420 [Anaerolineae bacterium]|jgi:hypothetical protein